MQRTLAADSSSTEGIEGEPELQDRDVDDCNVDVDVDEFEVDAEVFNKIERFLEPESSLEGQVESDDAQESSSEGQVESEEDDIAVVR